LSRNGIKHFIAAVKRGAGQTGSSERTFKYPADGAIVIDDPDYPSLHKNLTGE
jgi:hypothetical protein